MAKQWYTDGKSEVQTFMGKKNVEAPRIRVVNYLCSTLYNSG